MTSSPRVFRRNPFQTFKIFGTGALAIALLSGCDENGQFNFPAGQGTSAASTAGTTRSTKLVERDVEAPEVFSVVEEGLWDGRPSLGGVWVAHPDVTDPERVIVRNEDNSKFVIGALFRKERDLPGPKLQISSDAAAALGILAGAPAKLNVTALRREETEEFTEEELQVEEIEDVEAVDGVAAPAEVSATSLDPIAAAGAAIEAAPETAPAGDTAAAATATATTAATAAEPVAAAAPPAVDKPFIQIGIFSKERNAKRTAKQISNAGIISTVKSSEINGKPFWRVVVGPATSQAEMDTLTKAIKAEGFSDAYAVAN